MSQYTINIGALPNDGTGDPLRTAFNETNLNFNQIFAAGPVLSNIRIANNSILTLNTNGNLVLNPNGIGSVVANAHVLPDQTRIRNLGSPTLLWNTTYTQYLNATQAIIGTATIGNIGNITIPVGNLHISGGTNGYVLQTDGTGNLTWTAQTGGTGNGTPGGANTQVQFNDANSFGGQAGFTFDKTSNVLAVPGDINLTDGTVIQSSGGIQFPSSSSEWDLHSSDGNIYIGALPNEVAYIDTYSPNISVRLRTNEVNDWMFTPNGRLTTPGEVWVQSGDSYNSIVFTPNSVDNNGQIKVDGGQNMIVSSNNNFYVKRAEQDRLAITNTTTDLMASTDVRIQSNKTGSASTWTFGADGVLTTPGASGNITGANVISATTFAIAGSSTELGQIEGANTVGFYTSDNALQYLFEGPNNVTWGFNVGTGGTGFPTLNVQRGDNPSGTIQGQTLLFGDNTKEAIITTPDGNVSYPDSQRLVINPGAGASGTGGEGGDIYLWAGRGGDVDGNGGDVKIRGGQGMGNGPGGYLRIEAGDTQGNGTPGYIDITGGQGGNTAGGYVNVTGGYGATVGGDVKIYGGYGQATGGNVNIWGGASGNGQINEGHVNIETGGNTWTFDATGNLTTPGAIYGPADSFFNIAVTDSGPGASLQLGDWDIAGFPKSLVQVSDNVHIVTGVTTGGGDWSFDTNGYLTAPSDITITDGTFYGNNFNVADANGAVQFNNFGTVLTEEKPGDNQNYPATATTAITPATGTGCLLNVSYVYGDPAYSVSTSDGGTYSYNVGDQLKVLGNIIGGATPANDLIVQVASLYAGPVPGAVFDVSVVSGTPPVFPDGFYVRNNNLNWIFGTDGNLTLPTGGASINYANGQPYGGSGGGNADIGNWVFDANDATVNNSGYPRLFGGPDGGPEFTYLEEAGNNASYSQTMYINNEEGFFVSLDYGNAQFQFATNGNTYLPGNIITGGATGNITGANVIEANTFASLGNLQLFASEAQWTFDNTGRIVTGGNLKLAPSSANLDAYLDIYLTSGPDIHIAGNGENVIIGRDSGANVMVGIDGTVTIRAEDGGPVTWNFDVDGKLHVPQGGYLGAAGVKGDGTMLTGGPGNITSLSSYYADTDFYSSCLTANPDGTLNITTYGNGTGQLGQWTFSGYDTTVPGDILAQEGNDLAVQVFNPTSGGGVTYVVQNRQVDLDYDRTTQFEVAPANIVLTTDFSGNKNQWTFDNAGNLTAPGNISTVGSVTADTFATAGSGGDITLTGGDITGANVVTANAVSTTGNVTAANFFGNGNTLSNVATQVAGSWTVTTGTNTYSFTVGSGTYSMWVTCNIPNGILAWNATATVTNTNVPVVGTQYAWVYNGGGTPIDFVSIPNQFTGTANAIVRSNVAPSATTNRFDFSINNTSGGNVTVRYGWTQIS